MDRKQDSLTPLKDVISCLFRDGGLPFNPDDARIWAVWADAVGEGIAANARPAWIRQGTLRVEVSGPIWLQELAYMEADIRHQLNDKMGRCAVEKIEFRLGAG